MHTVWMSKLTGRDNERELYYWDSAALIPVMQSRRQRRDGTCSGKREPQSTGDYAGRAGERTFLDLGMTP